MMKEILMRFMMVVTPKGMKGQLRIHSSERERQWPSNNVYEAGRLCSPVAPLVY